MSNAKKFHVSAEPLVQHPLYTQLYIKRYGKVWQSLHQHVEQAKKQMRPLPEWAHQFYADSFAPPEVNLGCGCGGDLDNAHQQTKILTKQMQTISLTDQPMHEVYI